MSQANIEQVIRSKNFYVHTYRKSITFLIISSTLNIVLGAGIYYTYFNLPEPDYYATSGITPPVELKAMDTPNYSSTALLATEHASNYGEKVIPQ